MVLAAFFLMGAQFYLCERGPSIVARKGRKYPNDRSARRDYVSFRLAFLGAVILLLLLGCASNPPVSRGADRMWTAQLERQQQAAREAGRIGYIGNAGPACR